MQQTVNIKAGQLARVQMAGVYASLVITGAVVAVSVAFKVGNQVLEELRTYGRTLEVRSEVTFDAVELRAAADTVVELVVTNGRVTIDGMEGATVKVTADAPLPVSNDRGAPGAPVYVVGVTYSDAPAVSLGDLAPVAVTAALTAVVAADVARKELRITNMHATNAVAIGGAALTWGRRSVLLYPGDTWVEDRAANLALYAVCDAGQTATLNLQEVKA